MSAVESSKRHINLAIVCLALLGLPFLLIGLWVTGRVVFGFVGLLTIENPLHDLALGLIFALPGAGLMALALSSRGELIAEAEARELWPKQPWMWRRAWATGKIPGSGIADIVRGVIFALVFLLPGVFIFQGLEDELAQGNYIALVALAFPAVGLWMLYKLWRAVLQRLQFGSITLQISSPLWLGETSATTLLIPAAVPQGEKLHCALICMKTEPGRERDRESVHWREDWEEPLDTLVASGNGCQIPLRLTIPDGEPQTTAERGDGQVVRFRWLLEVRVRDAGNQIEAEFELPVFDQRLHATEQKRTASDILFGQSQAAAPGTNGESDLSGYEITHLSEQAARAKIAVVQDGDSLQLKFPRFRSPGTVGFLFVVLCVFIPATGGLWTLDDPLAHGVGLISLWMFRVVFSSMSLIILYLFLRYLLHRSEISVGLSGLQHKRGMFSQSTTEYPREDIASVSPEVGSTSSRRQYFRLILTTHEGRRTELAFGIPGRRLAMALALSVEEKMNIGFDGS